MGVVDFVVAGGGPAGSATAWAAAAAGARVVVVDRARFPRHKPCGDGVTPRGVALLHEMGLEQAMQRFYRADTIRLVTSRRTVVRNFTQREIGLPGYAYVAPRDELDTLLLEHAADAGAEVRQGAEAVAPLVEDGVVRGVRVRRSDGREEELRARVTVAADGMSSKVGKAAGLVPRQDRPYGIAMRAHVPAERPLDGSLEIHPEVRLGRKLVPGYGWAFPTLDGRLNVGVGYLTTYAGWRAINGRALFSQFLASLPASWGLPSAPELYDRGQVQGWKLPLGLSTQPVWRPGIMAVGDAAGVAKPFTGAGISKALQSGMYAAEAGLAALGAGGPHDLSAYGDRVMSAWGTSYRVGRFVAAAVGHPTVMWALVHWGLAVEPVAAFVQRLGSQAYDARALRGTDIAIKAIHRLSDAVPQQQKPPQQRPKQDRPVSTAHGRK